MDRSITTKLLLGSGVFKKSESFYNKFPRNMYLQTDDNERIGAFFFVPPAPTNNYILFCHGKGADRYITDSFVDFQMISDSFNCHILVIDYRGFADNNSEFTKEGCNFDLLAGLKYLHSISNENRNISIVAHSFGCALALEFIKKMVDDMAKDMVDNMNDNMSNKISNDNNDNMSNDKNDKQGSSESNNMNDKPGSSNFNMKYKKDSLNNLSFPKFVFCLAPFSSTTAILNDFSVYKQFIKLFPSFDTIERYLEYDSVYNSKIARESKTKLIIFHGEDDRVISKSHSEKICENSNCEFHILKGIGHFSIIYKKDIWKDIIARMNSYD